MSKKARKIMIEVAEFMLDYVKKHKGVNQERQVAYWEGQVAIYKAVTPV